MDQPSVSIDQHSLTGFSHTQSFTLSLQSSTMQEDNDAHFPTHSGTVTTLPGTGTQPPPRKYFHSSPNHTRRLSPPQDNSEIMDGKRVSKNNKKNSPSSTSCNYSKQQAVIGMPNRHSKSNLQIFKAPKSMTTHVKKTNIFDPKTYTWKPPDNDTHRSKRFDYNNLVDMSKLNSVFF